MFTVWIKQSEFVTSCTTNLGLQINGKWAVSSAHRYWRHVCTTTWLSDLRSAQIKLTGQNRVELILTEANCLDVKSQTYTADTPETYMVMADMSQLSRIQPTCIGVVWVRQQGERETQSAVAAMYLLFQISPVKVCKSLRWIKRSL